MRGESGLPAAGIRPSVGTRRFFSVSCSVLFVAMPSLCCFLCVAQFMHLPYA